MSKLKIAIVHEWYETVAGSERVVLELLNIFPEADLFGVVDFLSPRDRELFGHRNISTTFIQKLPGAAKHFRKYLPLMPLAIEQLDVSAYDLVLSSSHAVAKGVITGPRQLHISYVHSPIRYAWDLQHQYLRESGISWGMKGLFARASLHYMRLWDASTEKRVDHFIANSKFIAKRIRKVYGRQATVIYPPVDTERFIPSAQKEDFYLAASRMVPYKRMALIAEAFAAMPDKRLLMIGSGPDLDRIRALGAPNVEVLGYQPDPVLLSHMQRAKALVFAAEEDFGIAPVEAQACGTPVIAFGAGGALETVLDAEKRPGGTGVFFESQTAESIISAVTRFESLEPISATACRAHAERFSYAAFREAVTTHVMNCWQEHLGNGPGAASAAA